MSEKLKDANFDTGAVRSADVDHLDFASMPLMGLLGVIAVAGKGGIKYGRHNYSKGIPNHVTLNHMAVHLIRYIIGDRTEDHMSKVAWGAMVVNETEAKQPELSAPHMLGPGATLTEPMIDEMDRTKPERDRARQAGEFENLFDGTFADMPEVKAILGQRKKARWTKEHKDYAAKLRPILNKYIVDTLESNQFRRVVKFDGKPMFNGPPEAGLKKPEPVACPETAKQYASEVKANASALFSEPVACDDFVDPAPESLKEWCDRNPMSADAIQAKTLGLSGTGCPEPHATLTPSFAPGSTNSKVYGQANRTETSCGKPNPGPDETWVEYDDGTRAYYPKGRPRTPSHVPVNPSKTSDYYDSRSTPGGYFPRS